jgi:hypothetical protein
MKRWSFVLPLLTAMIACAAVANPPYPRSDTITGIEFHQDTLERKAPGSDIWACTCDAHGTVYATWGDGGGFGGTDSEGRASIGVAKIVGMPPDWKGANLWGGLGAESSQVPTVGKGTLICARGLLYLYVSEQGAWDRCRLWRSSDSGISWMDRGWLFPRSHKVFAFPGLVQYGPRQEAMADDYVYGFSDNDPARVKDDNLYLFRVKRDEIEDLNAYEYFCGNVRTPRWSRQLADRTSVFHDPAGIGWGTTCVYHPATGRYLLSVSIHDDLGDWGLYESKQLWGPWRTVAYGEDFPKWTYSPAEKDRPAYLHSFPAAWMSPDGRTLWCIFDRGDHFNLAKCTMCMCQATIGPRGNS